MRPPRRFVIREGLLVEVIAIVPMQARKAPRWNPLWRRARTALEFRLEARR